MQHYNRGIKADLTLKAVIGTVIKECFPRLNSTQRELFARGPFGSFLDMPKPNGDPLLVHTMMLHEVRTQALARVGRFGFSVQGIQFQYGETEFFLITGLKFGPFANLLSGTKNPKNSILRSRLMMP